MSYQVKVYVYELTKGLAKSISSIFLGTNIDGIWHTAIVYNGNEYFFGKGGIQIATPGIVIGPPDEIIDLGSTEIDPELFEEYLDSLRTANFTGEEYNLFNHNCNTFTNEVAQFLTDKTIPSHILDLPQQVLASPFGPLLQSYIENLESSFDPLANPFPVSSNIPSGSSLSLRPLVTTHTTTTRDSSAINSLPPDINHSESPEETIETEPRTRKNVKKSPKD